MFPADSLAGVYCEERKLADAKRVAELRAQQEKVALHNAQKTSSSATACHGNLAHTVQSPSMRPGLFGGIFQGLVKSASGASTPSLTSFNSSRAPTPMHSPNHTPTAAEIEAALVAEKKRDADICAMPAWYH